MSAPQTKVLITAAGSEHAREVHLNYDRALIEDLGSSNGSQVNGQPVSGTMRLWPNQKFKSAPPPSN